MHTTKDLRTPEQTLNLFCGEHTRNPANYLPEFADKHELPTVETLAQHIISDLRERGYKVEFEGDTVEQMTSYLYRGIGLANYIDAGERTIGPYLCQETVKSIVSTLDSASLTCFVDHIG